jgi:hypothetical protein
LRFLLCLGDMELAQVGISAAGRRDRRLALGLPEGGKLFF